MQTLEIIRPDDWHVHLRDNDVLQHTVAATATHFARALVMPNLTPPLTTLPALNDYYERIKAAIPSHTNFQPYMTFYLNEALRPETLYDATSYHYILGCKFYPKGATTNSEAGVTSIRALYPLLDIMQDKEMVLQIHGEITHGDIFERESLFITDVLVPLMRDFPKLRIVLEHISTKAAAEFIAEAREGVAATITPHHLLYNRNALLAGGIKPHYYCLPILKSERDQVALQKAATSGHPKFFAGTDSAPHDKAQKENSCGCAGIYSAPFALAMYAQAFSENKALPKLNHFMSRFGAEFYRLPLSNEHIELIEKSQVIPTTLPLGKKEVVPVAAGSALQWGVRE